MLLKTNKPAGVSWGNLPHLAGGSIDRPINKVSNLPPADAWKTGPDTSGPYKWRRRLPFLLWHGRQVEAVSQAREKGGKPRVGSGFEILTGRVTAGRV